MTIPTAFRPLEYWDGDRQRWIMYRSQAEHSEDCARFPYEAMPLRIFLDTSVVNILVKFEDCIFRGEPIPEGLPQERAHDIESLMHLTQVGARANWVWTTSPKALEEIANTPNPYLRGELLSYANELLFTHNESYGHAVDLGRRSIGAPFLKSLADEADRELVGNAIGLGCDTFCTSDRRTIIRFREQLKDVPIRIVTPIEWWKSFKPWGGLFA